MARARQTNHHEYGRYLRLILDNVSDLIAIVDVHGRRLYNSPSYSPVLGDPASLRGTDSFTEIHPDDQLRVKRVFEETIRTRRGRTTEYRFVRSDGAIRYIESHGNVVLDAKGRPTKVVVVSRDITERKRAAEELYEAQLSLIQSEKMASLGQLAAGIAHELKNPLAIITQGMRYFERDLGQLGEEQADVLQMVREAAKRADDIVKQVLRFSRPSPLTLRPQPLRPVVEAALALVQKQLLIQDVDATVDIPADLPLASLDETTMQQVFLNLFMNAYQAMPRGGRLTVRASPTILRDAGHGVGSRATDRFRPGDSAILCEVTDTGVGIPPAELVKVFDPFFTTKPAGEGTGLGLSIVKTIIEGHRGLIQLASREGQGTSVRVVLPIATEGPCGNGRSS